MSLYLMFLAAMLLQVIAGRTQLLAMRGGIRDSSGLLSSLIGIVAGLSFFAVIIWGFATLHWYFVLPAILVMGFISGLVVNLRSFAFWYQIRPLIDTVVIGVTAFLWAHYWPF